ncbi:sensor histidine kinase [Mycobacterium tuberculosis CCDC5079]|nr:sensor histidine kinase [Mycobacterium tuberculosis CCDC5079]
MNILSRIFARTPSLRTRVVVATAIGAAIPVLIVGTVVWVGITNDRKERLDRRLDEAAGFAIPFVPRGLDEIPRSPNDQDALITVRRGNVIKSNSDITLPKLQVRLRRHIRPRGALPRAHGGDPRARADVGGGGRDV